jgi:threonine dehydratase/serine racemase
MTYAIDFAAVLEASKRITGKVKRTSVVRSDELDKLAGRELFFKCENLQHCGAFKYRGALNAIICLEEKDEVRGGICTHSSGNHAQAVAGAALDIGVNAHIVMPKSASEFKVEGVKQLGAFITFCEPDLKSREATAAYVLRDTQASFVHPYDNPNVIAGQGTAVLEFMEHVGEPECSWWESRGIVRDITLGEFDALITPVGGGGLLAGTCIAARATQPNCRLFGAEPIGADDAARSLAAGKLIPQTGPHTICDGLLTSLGELTWPILRDHLESIVTVTDDEVVEAMRLLHQHLDMIVEPSGAIPLAAVLSDQFKALNGIERVGLILSGGNIDPRKLPFRR